MRVGWVFWIALAALAGFAIWVRVAPSAPETWHVDLTFDQDATLTSGAQRVIKGDAATLQALDQIARETPRTEVLAGAVEAGHITYVTRSALWGFPDYTTVQLSGDQIHIWARLRFGRSDLGVNGTRLKGWIDALAAGQG